MYRKGVEGFFGKYGGAGGIFGAGSGVYGAEHKSGKVVGNRLLPVCPKIFFLRGGFGQACNRRLKIYHKDKFYRHIGRRRTLTTNVPAVFICRERNISM